MSNSEFFLKVQKKSYFTKMMDFINEAYSEGENKKIFPPRGAVFKAFDLCPLEECKVVIIGQDPYHEVNQANGLAFSVNSGVPLPPSLQNIYKEIEYEYDVKMKNDGDLTYLAKQGVLLLNVYLTVEEGKPLSHKHDFYEDFIKDVFSYLDTLDKSIVFLLWGSFARKFAPLVKNNNHRIIETVHPSPLSANRGGWFEKNQFKRANNFLLSMGEKPIDWKN